MYLSYVVSAGSEEAKIDRVPDDEQLGNRVRITFGAVTLFVTRDDALELAGAIRQAATS